MVLSERSPYDQGKCSIMAVVACPRLSIEKLIDNLYCTPLIQSSEFAYLLNYVTTLYSQYSICALAVLNAPMQSKNGRMERESSRNGKSHQPAMTQICGNLFFLSKGHLQKYLSQSGSLFFFCGKTRLLHYDCFRIVHLILPVVVVRFLKLAELPSIHPVRLVSAFESQVRGKSGEDRDYEEKGI